MALSVDRINGISGDLAIKAPCRVATTAAITLAGFQTIDGVTLAEGDQNLRVLVKNQTDTTQNGIYNADSGAWSRSTDFNGASDVVKGTLCAVSGGATNGSILWQLSGTDPIVPGATPITFTGNTPFAAVTAFILTLFDDADATAARATLDAAASNVVSSALGVSIQAYDADTAKLDVDQTWTGAQRGTLTTDNDGSFDQNVTNKFKCTPTGAVALTFTNHTSGQGGTVIFINGSNYAITAAATTYIAAADLTKLSATGTYLIGYEDDGTNAYCAVTAALTSAGA